ncbi:hypothetical protein ACIREM_14505 [Streptomyces shenzhenensis]
MLGLAAPPGPAGIGVGAGVALPLGEPVAVAASAPQLLPELVGTHGQ